MIPRLLLPVLGFCFAAVAQTWGFDVESVRSSIVRIILPIVAEDGSSGEFTGSGFVVSSDFDGSFLVTNHHVVTLGQGYTSALPDKQVLVGRLNGGKVECYVGTIVWADEYHDLAVVRVADMKAEPLSLSTLDPPAGEDVYSLGFPGMTDNADADSSEEFARQFANATDNVLPDPTGKAARYVTASVSKGGVRRVVLGKWDSNHPVEEFKFVESDVNFTGGNSGGPLLNACGHVVGVNTAMWIEEATEVLRKSSHSSALVSLLRRQGIPFTSTSEPCAPAAASVPAQHKNLLALVAMLAAAALGTAIFVAVRKPQVVRETYTQFMRRAGESTQTLRQVVLGTRQEKSVKQAGAKSSEYRENTASNEPSSQTSLTLQGHDPEDRDHPSILWHLPREASGKQIIGRKSGLVHLRIVNSSVSGQHAAVWRDQEVFFIEDRNSSNGTLANGQKLHPFEARRLSGGDRIQLGDIVLQVSIS